MTPREMKVNADLETKRIKDEIVTLNKKLKTLENQRIEAEAALELGMENWPELSPEITFKSKPEDIATSEWVGLMRPLLKFTNLYTLTESQRSMVRDLNDHVTYAGNVTPELRTIELKELTELVRKLKR